MHKGGTIRHIVPFAYTGCVHRQTNEERKLVLQNEMTLTGGLSNITKTSELKFDFQQELRSESIKGRGV